MNATKTVDDHLEYILQYQKPMKTYHFKSESHRLVVKAMSLQDAALMVPLQYRLFSITKIH